jgi:hypothetical protein
MKIKHIFVYYKKIGVRFFRTRLPGRVFGYLFSAPSERLEDYCKYPENDSLPEIEFVGGDVKISGYGKLRTLVKFNIQEPKGSFKIQVNCAPVVTTSVQS